VQQAQHFGQHQASSHGSNKWNRDRLACEFITAALVLMRVRVAFVCTRYQVRAAHKEGRPQPLPPEEADDHQPQVSRLRQSDVTIKKLALLLATAAPKGLQVIRDELSGWLLAMSTVLAVVEAGNLSAAAPQLNTLQDFVMVVTLRELAIELTARRYAS
jgi:hypothetical protein